MSTMVVEQIDAEDWLVREVYARFGLAMYEAQVVEQGIVNVAHLTSIRDRTFRTLSDLDDDNAKLLKQTMGMLRRTLMDRRSDIDQLEDLLIRAVRLRNFLAHEYFRQRAAAFMTEDGKNQMIEELQSAVSFLDEVDSKLHPLAADILKATGMDKHMPEALEKTSQAGFGDPLPGLGC